MAVNLTPWNGLDVEKLKVWVHRILPLVYDDSLSYYEVLAKVGAKMNEVIEGLNANNEQVEKVTGFTIEQVQNLTLAFNNFQQSMLTRQEEFENRVLDSQQNFETQLKGDIANWEAETEEKFRTQYEKDAAALNDKYADFLSKYQKNFGVSQSVGDSTTDVFSQKLSTDTLTPMVTCNSPVVYNQQTKTITFNTDCYIRLSKTFYHIPAHTTYTLNNLVGHAGANVYYNVNNELIITDLDADWNEYGSAPNINLKIGVWWDSGLRLFGECICIDENGKIPSTYIEPIANSVSDKVLENIKNSQELADNILSNITEANYLDRTSNKIMPQKNMLTVNTGVTFVAYGNVIIDKKRRKIIMPEPRGVNRLQYGQKYFNLNQNEYDIPTNKGGYVGYDYVNDKFVEYAKLSNDFIPLGYCQADSSENFLIISNITNTNCPTLTCLGDSITTGTGATYTYRYYLQRNLFYRTVVDKGYGGSTIARDFHGFVERMTEFDDDDTDILIFGGTNDYSRATPLGDIDSTDDTTFYGALNVLFSHLINAHPENNIYVFTPTQRGINRGAQKPGSDSLHNSLNLTIFDYANAMIKTAAKYGIPCKDLTSDCFYNTTQIMGEEDGQKGIFSNDGLHPNDAGHLRIAQKMIGFINAEGAYPHFTI